MVNYLNGKIYKLVTPYSSKVYVGSTTSTLYKRLGEHKCHYKEWILNPEKYAYRTSFDIYDFDEDCVKIVLLEECPCDNRDQLCKREYEYITTLDCVNKMITGRTNKQRYAENYNGLKDKVRIRGIQYRKDNYEFNKQQKLKYRNANKEKISEHDRLYRQNNSQIIMCDCGFTFKKYKIADHRKTKQHQKWVNLSKPIIVFID